LQAVVDKIEYRRFDAVPNSASLHSTKKLPHGRFLQLPQTTELQSLPHAIFYLFDRFLPAI
jgi:hypothetical protein